MLLREPPAPGSRNPLDIAALLREGGRAAGLSQRDVHDLVRIFTMSVGDLLDDWFEHDAVKGSIASSGVVGVWAGPRTPGTAYNLLHHALGELDGMPGVWGQVIGGTMAGGRRVTSWVSCWARSASSRRSTRRATPGPICPESATRRWRSAPISTRCRTVAGSMGHSV